MTDIDLHDFQRLVDTQFGIVTQSQLEPFGFSRGRVRHLLDSGQWRRVLQGVYAVTNGPLTRDMILSAALLYGGGHSMLSHITAAEEWGMVPRRDGEPIHITVPYGKSSRCQSETGMRPSRKPGNPIALSSPLHPGVVVHRSRAHDYIAVDTDPPRTTRADTALDLAIAEPTARDAYTRLIALVTNARIPLRDIRRRMEERRPRRYRKALVDAVLEYRCATDVEDAHGLPRARRQSPVVVDGRTLFEDCDYSDNGVPLIVRLDGRRAHAMAEVAFRDRRRDNAAELQGRPRLVYGFDEVTKNPCEVAREVETVLVREGWIRPGERPCPACAPFWLL
ncbi:type IV toxin-antitoxin system AbiEi family antitoxin domain-containing protein [Rhodococcus opacus]|uniref:type IV toxin-antitoxin system AbiEi family antitoxin domain-containing protein n=1 Tax=Rhodococcus opacus TaxID=37919 RepID=UPI00155A7E2F|nr:type IV toxin-antitoxin system AbiEi family antitoxin domain-containing protein [Rhodococcus opacus]